jgi:enoyl-CoA hydratase/carnithine racemase
VGGLEVVGGSWSFAGQFRCGNQEIRQAVIIRIGPKLCYTSLNETLETQMENEAHEIADGGNTEDFREGIAAFMEKRPPAFRGR